jgi:hypothetical protein
VNPVDGLWPKSRKKDPEEQEIDDESTATLKSGNVFALVIKGSRKRRELGLGTDIREVKIRSPI